jgi:hypothetical protein
MLYHMPSLLPDHVAATINTICKLFQAQFGDRRRSFIAALSVRLTSYLEPADVLATSRAESLFSNTTRPSSLGSLTPFVCPTRLVENHDLGVASPAERFQADDVTVARVEPSLTRLAFVGPISRSRLPRHDHIWSDDEEWSD